MDLDSVSSTSQVPKPGKFYWTPELDTKLVACLLELSLSTYWKVDTTFRVEFKRARKYDGSKNPRVWC